MVIIAIFNIPQEINLKQLVKILAPTIKGHFEALNFTHSKDNNKTAYIRLTEKLFVKDVINRINSKKIGTNQVKAFIPDSIPNLPLATAPRTISSKQQSKLKILNESSKQFIKTTVDNIMSEMQTKYPGLYDLSYTTKHELLETIGQTVYQRLVELVGDPRCKNGTCFRLSMTYRKDHLHGTDFKLILRTLHSIEDAQRKPRTQLKEDKLAAIPNGGFYLMPYEQLISTVESYISRISNRLVEHVDGLEVTEQATTDADAAQMNVRKHLKALRQHYPGMVRNVIMNHVGPACETYSTVRIYGEPYLPHKSSMTRFTQQYEPVFVIRSHDMYNLLLLKVHRRMYVKLLARDGHMINGVVRLTIRPDKLPFYKVSRYIFEAGVSDDGRQDEGATDGRQDEDMEWAEAW